MSLVEARARRLVRASSSPLLPRTLISLTAATVMACSTVSWRQPRRVPPSHAPLSIPPSSPQADGGGGGRGGGGDLDHLVDLVRLRKDMEATVRRLMLLDSDDDGGEHHASRQRRPHVTRRAEHWFRRQLRPPFPPSPSAETGAFLLIGLARAGRTARLEHWYQEIRLLGVRPPRWAYRAVLELLLRTQVAGEARTRGGSTSTAAASSGRPSSPSVRPSDLERWAERCLRRNLTVANAICERLCEGFGREGRHGHAEKWGHVLLKERRGGDADGGGDSDGGEGDNDGDGSAFPSTSATNALVVACATAGRLRKADTWVSALRRRRGPRSVTAETFAAAVKAAVAHGSGEMAQRWFLDFLRAYNGSEELLGGEAPGVWSLRNVTNFYANELDWRRARSCLEEAVVAGVPPDHDACCFVVKALSKAGEAELADELLERMLEAGLIPHSVALDGYIAMCMRDKNPQKAQKLLKRIADLGTFWGDIFH
mmetsp:Transcript_7371/g.17968  ORF Transcript_7371/g.17968 Transcript_7371/m.17968 type:complete len:484 (-) Transcript_7371:93-1544(-)